MILVVALLVETFATILADERFDSLVYSHVGIQGRRPVKGLATRSTNVGFLRSVNDLVATQSGCLSKPLIAHLHKTVCHM